jgi:hypothetical protein
MAVEKKEEGNGGKGVEGLKEKLGVGTEPKKDPPSEPEKKDPPPTAEREPGADEGENALPFGKTEKAPTDSSEIPAYLNRATSIEDLSVRWLAGQPVIEKAGARMQEAFKKLRDDREKALKGGTK